MSNSTAHSLPSPCWCCPTAAWDQQWRHCETGGSGLTQLFCCPGLAWPPPETSPPSPTGTPHPPGAVALTATANIQLTFCIQRKKKEKNFTMLSGIYISIFVLLFFRFNKQTAHTHAPPPPPHLYTASDLPLHCFPVLCLTWTCVPPADQTPPYQLYLYKWSTFKVLPCPVSHLQTKPTCSFCSASRALRRSASASAPSRCKSLSKMVERTCCSSDTFASSILWAASWQRESLMWTSISDRTLTERECSFRNEGQVS